MYVFTDISVFEEMSNNVFNLFQNALKIRWIDKGQWRVRWNKYVLKQINIKNVNGKIQWWVCRY